MARVNPRHGFTLVEIMIALGVSGLLFTVLTAQLIESGKLTARITQTLEHSRNAREVIDTISADVRAAQILRILPSFTERATEARDGQYGNYLLLQAVDATGTITRTVGYYLVALGNSHGWALYRHDSSSGDGTAANPPASGTVGSHRMIKRAVRLPEAGLLFRCARDRGVSIHGEFSSPDTAGSARTEFIRCTISTRS